MYLGMVLEAILRRILRRFLGESLNFEKLVDLFVRTEPVFVVLSKSPGINSQPAGPVPRQLYLSYQPARLHTVSWRKSIPGDLFLGSINLYKYGLCSEH
jgi:hypothetical protein